MTIGNTFFFNKANTNKATTDNRHRVFFNKANINKATTLTNLLLEEN